MSSPHEVLIKNPSAITKKTLLEAKNGTLKCLKQHYSTVRSMKKVAMLTENGAFALFLHYHLGGFDRLKSPHPQEFAIQGKKNASARGCWAQLELTDA